VADKEEHPAAQAYLEAAKKIAEKAPPKVWSEELRLL
jgi:hypothetical protein